MNDTQYTSGLIPLVKLYSNVNMMKAQILSDNKKVSGVYAFQFSPTSEIVYVGSSSDISRRFKDHLNDHRSNIILQQAFSKYGLDAFHFLILEIYYFDWEITIEANRDLFNAREQYYLDCVKPRYNILKKAGTSLGYTHTEEALALMSVAKSGANNPMFGRAGENNPMFGKTGDNHPFFGKTHSSETRALMSKSVSVYSTKTGLLIQQYSGMVVASKALSINYRTIKKYLLSGLPYRGILFK